MKSAVAYILTSLAPVPLLLLAASEGGVFAWAALIYLTLFTFLLDEVLATALEAKPTRTFADALCVALAIAHFAVLIAVLLAFQRGMGPGEGVALFLAAGLFLGQISNANGHELIHRGGRVLQVLGKWIYISLLFGHHCSAHRLVHHRFVASNRDPNSARLGESYYRFAVRAWIGSFRAGLKEENQRLVDIPPWRHPYFDYVIGALICLTFSYVLAGPTGLLIHLALAGYAQSQLLISDYVQHYGLRRASLPNGKLEPVNDSHSWNSPHWFSSHLMLNAPRHSSHHSHPMRAFPELDIAPDAPTLPYSLPAMSVLALIPPLWRRIMDPRVALWQAPIAQKAAA